MESETPDPIPGGNVPDTVPTDFAIAERHRAVLEAGGIDVKLAADFGIRTVENPIELPPDTSSLHGAPPGLLFPLPHLDGSLTHQVRLDEPPVDEKGKPVGKYMTQADHPAFATAWPTEQAKADDGTYRTVLIVEGTKQTLAAVCSADDDTLVLGIQGCWGWMSQQAPIDDFNDLVSGKQVVVAFDADVSTNPNVHRAAKMFSAHLTERCGAKVVRWLRTGDTGTSGLDDYLGKDATGDRQRALANLIKAARKLPRAPIAATGRSDQVLEADLGAQVLRRPVDSAFDAVPVDLKGPIVFAALPRIVETTAQLDDLGDDPRQVLEHTIEVAIPDRGTFTVKASDDELKDPSKWMARVPSGFGGEVLRPIDLANRNRLENTLRTLDADSRRLSTAFGRTGWVHRDGEAMYVFPGGAIGPLNLVTDISCRLGGVASKISFPDPHLFEAGEVEDIRAFLSQEDALNDPTPFWVLVGAALAAIAGVPPSGLIMVVGEPGTGKTHIAQAVTGMLGPDLGPGRAVMATLEGTANAITSAGAGLHHCFVLVDDVHPQMDRNRAAAQLDAISTLARRSYSGGSAGKRRLNWDSKTGRVTEGYVDLSSPLILMTSESSPDATLMRSLVERMFVINVSKDSTYKPGEADRIAKLVRSGAPNRMLARFIRWVANQLTDDIRQSSQPPTGTDMTAFLNGVYMDASDESRLGAIIESQVSDSRLREVLAPPLIGTMLLTQYAEERGAITSDEKLAVLGRAWGCIFEAMQAHQERNLSGDAETWRSVLAAIKALIVSGKAEILSLDSDGDVDVSPNTSRPVPVIGKHHTTTSGERVIALVPHAVIQLIHQPSIVSTQTLGNALSSAVIRSKNTVTTQVRFGVDKYRCLLVRLDAWEEA